MMKRAALAAVLTLAAVLASAADLTCSIGSQTVSTVEAALLYCGTDPATDVPVLLLCTEWDRGAFLTGGGTVGEQVAVTLTIPGGEPLHADWTVAGRGNLLKYETEAPDGDSVTDALLAIIAAGAPLTYTAGDVAHSYPLAQTHEHALLAVTWERACGLLRG